ncbi:inositol monophosphatase family protein [Streptantibioticus parmotrematis]|uniref:inositol monophosphatase family protein n=1 Tax=Streptantibioticus parmotrematis TaxID=2873249 RepID=UPI0033C8A6F8
MQHGTPTAPHASLTSPNPPLDDVVAAVEQAGGVLGARLTPRPRGVTLDEIVEEIHANDAAVLAVLKPRLLALRPGSRWAQDELAGGALPSGEWWVVDPAEGNINHVHGMTDWAVTATLVRDNKPVLTVVHLPLTGETYTAEAGHGARLNGAPIQVSRKTALDAALVGTGQARPGESAETFRRIGASVTAMLTHGLVVRVSVPATLQLVHVAAGRTDVFWQFSDVRSGLVAGALLVAEAGGTVTSIDGEPWTPGRADFLACAPGLHARASAVLASIA